MWYAIPHELRVGEWVGPFKASTLDPADAVFYRLPQVEGDDAIDIPNDTINLRLQDTGCLFCRSRCMHCIKFRFTAFSHRCTCKVN